MSKIQLSFTNDSNFSKIQIKIIENATILAKEFISSKFDFDYCVNLIVTKPSDLIGIIPEDGIGGRTLYSNLIMIAVDPNQKISKDFFYETLCHELSHSIRWQKCPEHSKTLLDVAIFEGLATVLEETATKDAKDIQFFLKEMQSTSQDMINKILKVLANKLHNENYDYDKIFFDGDKNLPRWSGYRLGYYLVKKYLQDNKTDIYHATFDSYDKFNKL